MRRPGGKSDIELDVHGLAQDGRGVGRLDGKTVFVTGALPGEQVRARIERSHARFDEAHVLSVLQPSPARTTPRCPHHGACGGCTLQYLLPEAQLAARQAVLADCFARIARTQPVRWLDPVASAPWGYRARARFAVGRNGASAHARLGFRREDSRQVEPIGECAVLEPALGMLIAPLTELLAGLEEPAALREILAASGTTGVALAFDCRAEPSPADRARLDGFCSARGLHCTLRVQDAPWPTEVAPLEFEVEPGVRLAFAPWHFTQANRAVNQALVACVLERLAPRAEDRALDLFCGIGNFTLPLARRVQTVTGVDGGAAEIVRARANAAANGASNAQFLLADLAREPPAASWTREHYDLVILDPPRSGATALVPLLGRLAPRCLAYVSCDPATLARDTAQLLKQGFALALAGVLDMFPHTAHFESLALFTRARGARRG